MNRALKEQQETQKPEETNVIKLQIRYLAAKAQKPSDEKFSWVVLDKKTNKPYDKWATINLEENVAKSIARRLNKQLTIKLNKT